jgi:Zn-dependent peptidase ImmA (M78 family)
METTTCKPEVLNPISFFNTIGQEIELMVEAKQKEKEELLKLLDENSFDSIFKLNKQKRETVIGYLGLDEDAKKFIIDFQNKYKETKEKAKRDYTESLKIFKKIKHIIPFLRGEFIQGIDILADIADYFGVEDEKDILKNAEIESVKFRKNPDVNIDTINLKAWLRRGELDLEKMQISSYNAEGLKEWIDAKSWKEHIEEVSYFMTIPDEISRFGIALVYTHFLPKTVYGAVRWIDEKPLIQLSDRNRDLASCWFTLFHEFGHVILHRSDESIIDFEINNSTKEGSKQEKEANKFANEHLFNGDSLRKEVFLKNGIKNIQSLSDKYGVSPLFCSYWLKKAQVNPTFQHTIPIEFN